jgi:hypothetical protein
MTPNRSAALTPRGWRGKPAITSVPAVNRRNNAQRVATPSSRELLYHRGVTPPAASASRGRAERHPSARSILKINSAQTIADHGARSGGATSIQKINSGARTGSATSAIDSSSSDVVIRTNTKRRGSHRCPGRTAAVERGAGRRAIHAVGAAGRRGAVLHREALRKQRRKRRRASPRGPRRRSLIGGVACNQQVLSIAGVTSITAPQTTTCNGPNATRRRIETATPKHTRRYVTRLDV